MARLQLCEDDCVQESKARPASAGRAGFVRGNVVAIGASGRSRSLKIGQPVYGGERIVTSGNSYAVLVFRDKGRVTVIPNSEFKIEVFEFDVQIWQDQLVFDELPDNACHLVAIEFDDRIRDLDFTHRYLSLALGVFSRFGDLGWES